MNAYSTTFIKLISNSFLHIFKINQKVYQLLRVIAFYSKLIFGCTKHDLVVYRIGSTLGKHGLMFLQKNLGHFILSIFVVILFTMALPTSNKWNHIHITCICFRFLQGAQAIGMGKDAQDVPAAAELYRKAHDILGYCSVSHHV